MLSKNKVLKAIFTVLLVLSLSVPAMAASYSFWIENFGESSYSATSASKTDTLSAKVNSQEHTTYWPSSGVVFRVRNADRDYATVAKAFSNGQSQSLSYLSGQNYTGTKWLYGSIEDNKAEGYDLLVSGTWTP